MPNYQEGKIYMIWSTVGPSRYYGSTCCSLSSRMCNHRSTYRCGVGITSSKVFEMYGVDNCKIELVENYPCTSKEELDAREGFYIRNNECVNQVITGRTSREYYNDCKEELKDKNKKYKENHKDELKEKSRKYSEEHREEQKVKSKKYYKEHREEQNAKRRERYANKKATTQ
jgi:hypothetical protein